MRTSPALARRSPAQHLRATIVLADQYMKEERYQAARQLYDAIEPQLEQSQPAIRYDLARRRGAIEMGIGNGLKALEHFRETVVLAELQHNLVQKANALISCAFGPRVPTARSCGPSSIISTRSSWFAVLRSSRTKRCAYRRPRLMACRTSTRSKSAPTRPTCSIRPFAFAASLGCAATRGARPIVRYRRRGVLRARCAEKALAHLELAEEIFKDLDSSQSRPAIAQHEPQAGSQWFGKIYSAQGRAYSAPWELATQPEERQQSLDKAEAILLQAVAQAIAADRPRAYQRLGFVYAATPERRGEAVEALGHRPAPRPDIRRYLQRV